MAVQSGFSLHTIRRILSEYDLSPLTSIARIEAGTTQTNIVLETADQKYIFRYYETRSRHSVEFESHILLCLAQYEFPCPRQVANIHGEYIGEYRQNPFILYHYIEGHTIHQPNDVQRRQLIHRIAQFNAAMQDYAPISVDSRIHYIPSQCQVLAQEAAQIIDTPMAYEKLKWFNHQVQQLDLPHTLTKSINHCDVHFDNLLYQGNELVALLDFDKANYTYLTYDLATLLDLFAWPYGKDAMNLAQAKAVMDEYLQHHQLSALDRHHLYDVHKLAILMDCIWYFDRGGSTNFYEKRKLEYLRNLTREQYNHALFSS